MTEGALTSLTVGLCDAYCYFAGQASSTVNDVTK